MDNLNKVMDLMELRREYVEALKRLQRNTSEVGTGTGDGFSNCPTVKFEVKYGAHVHWHSVYDDGELNAMLVNVATLHIQSKIHTVNETLENINTVIGSMFEPKGVKANGNT